MNFGTVPPYMRSTLQRSWLRYCATIRQAAGLTPDCVNVIFHCHNPSGCTLALGSTQPLTEMSTKNISCRYRQPMSRADNLTTFMCLLSWNRGTSTSWNLVIGFLYLYLHIWHQLNIALSPYLIQYHVTSTNPFLCEFFLNVIRWPYIYRKLSSTSPSTSLNLFISKSL
jgi:hypothetical protein